MSTIEDFGKGDFVNVKRLPDDDFNHDFSGHVVQIKRIRGDLIVVEDQDGDCWDCIPEQLSHCSDDYMH